MALHRNEETHEIESFYGQDKKEESESEED